MSKTSSSCISIDSAYKIPLFLAPIFRGLVTKMSNFTQGTTRVLYLTLRKYLVNGGLPPILSYAIWEPSLLPAKRHLNGPTIDVT